LKADPPLRRFLGGAAGAYRRFLLKADPAHRFHCGVMIRAVEPRGWTNSSTGKRVMKSPDSHRTARTSVRAKRWLLVALKGVFALAGRNPVGA
jgi:hypothetical protein